MSQSDKGKVSEKFSLPLSVFSVSVTCSDGFAGLVLADLVAARNVDSSLKQFFKQVWLEREVQNSVWVFSAG